MPKGLPLGLNCFITTIYQAFFVPYGSQKFIGVFRFCTIVPFAIFLSLSRKETDQQIRTVFAN
ncbi:hypothetical protein B0A64_13575 [Flavobacterium araucananum]|uniref:Uncharacterized protein n=1 Tax=Flavobacterium araucananum TaxID=946678 RepID=A0A227P555_9FLAO|nr:hypothetical protein B0A64_13575 [Flavobacterium araucananum]